MDCKGCKQPMLAESLDEHRKRYRCVKCGLSEIVDDQGRKLLVDDPVRSATPLLS